MKKRDAFTLIELLVVIAIIAILAAILFPVFAQAKVAAKKIKNLAHVKQHATSVHIYLSDADDVFPLANFHRETGTVTWNVTTPFPGNWNVPAEAAWNTPIRIDGITAYWANSTYPYIKSYGLYDDTGFPTTLLNVAGALDATILAAGTFSRPPEKTNVTYNGLLSQLEGSTIASPALVPMYWQGNGDLGRHGRSIANPALRCDSTTTPFSACKFNPTGAAQAGASANAHSWGWFWNGGKAYVYGRGLNFSYADSSAHFVPAGPNLGPTTFTANSWIHPWSSILVSGSPWTMRGCSYAFTNNPSITNACSAALPCYACYFRPDRLQ